MALLILIALAQLVVLLLLLSTLTHVSEQLSARSAVEAIGGLERRTVRAMVAEAARAHQRSKVSPDQRLS